MLAPNVFSLEFGIKSQIFNLSFKMCIFLELHAEVTYGSNNTVSGIALKFSNKNRNNERKVNLNYSIC